MTGVTVFVVLHPPLEADEPLVTRDETANTLHANGYFKAHMQVAAAPRCNARCRRERYTGLGDQG